MQKNLLLCPAISRLDKSRLEEAYGFGMVIIVCLILFGFLYFFYR